MVGLLRYRDSKNVTFFVGTPDICIFLWCYMCKCILQLPPSSLGFLYVVLTIYVRMEETVFTSQVRIIFSANQNFTEYCICL
jgi:hypothetical protein